MAAAASSGLLYLMGEAELDTVPQFVLICTNGCKQFGWSVESRKPGLASTIIGDVFQFDQEQLAGRLAIAKTIVSWKD